MKIISLMRYLLFLSLFLLCQTAAMAQCASGDCTNGTGIYLFPSGAKYIGQFVDGKPNGIGTCYYSDGSRYQGEWKDNYPEGRGVKFYKDGNKWVGTWKKGKQEEEEGVLAAVEEAKPNQKPDKKPVKVVKEQQQGCVSGDCTNGRGIYIYPSGAIYIGDFKYGEIHGIGVCHYSDGSKYQGNWRNRFPEGKGTKTWPDGTKWSGSWKKGKPVDETGLPIEAMWASRTMEDLNVQSGCIEGNCESGTGVFAYPDGSKYEGQFANRKPDGWGTFTYADNSKYEGTLRNGQPNGKGTMYKTDGTKLAGIWADGEYRGSAVIENGLVGCQEGDCKGGKGTYIYKDGSAKYVGSFLGSVPHGKGVIFYANGERYTGDWVGGSFDGEGTLVRTDGTEVKGQWKKGTYMGPNQPSILEAELAEAAPIQTKASVPTTFKIWAVVIGVAAYDHMPTLRYTDDDAYRFYAFLKSPEGGALSDDQVRILIDEDASLVNIKRTMRDIFAKAGPNDLVMLYFSGHGVQGAFLPIDFDGYNNKFDHTEVKKIFEESNAKYKLCIADACHSGSLLGIRSTKAQDAMAAYYATLSQASGGTALLMSSKSDETSLESSGLRQGVFSHFLIRGLKGEADLNKDSTVTIQELFAFIDNNVRSYTGNRQSPLIQGDYDHDMTVSVLR